MTFTSGGGDTVMVWLRHDDAMISSGWPPPFFLAIVDGNGLESRLLQNANMTRILNPGKPAAPRGNQICGWELKEFPRRANETELRVYCQDYDDRIVRIAEFKVRNPRPVKLPPWTAETLPATRTTNELEITLTRLETGLTEKETGFGPAGDGAKSFSRATFAIKENGTPTEKWSACGISASNAVGEIHPGGSYGSRWSRGEHKVDFDGALWLEEAAWKLVVDFARTGDFPLDELWSVKGVSVPGAGWLMETRIATNLFSEELEFLGVSGPKTHLPEGYAGIQPHANIHVRTPHPMDGLRLGLVEVRDDQGRKLATKGSTVRTSMGGRGNTPREMLHGFAVEIPEDAKSLDIRFAATRVRSVEFLAKPVMFDSKSEVQESKSE
jgi:hypothetical protein